MDNQTFTITDNRTNQTYTMPISHGTIAQWICARSRPGPTISA